MDYELKTFVAENADEKPHRRYKNHIEGTNIGDHKGGHINAMGLFVLLRSVIISCWISEISI